jgi:hypothetical protein
LDLVSTEATQELIRQLLVLLNAKDYATETTLNAIKAQTDKLTFDVDELKVTGSGGGGDAETTFGDTGTTATVALTAVSATVSIADTDKKEVVIVNTTGKKIWIKYGAAAVFGTGIIMQKDDILIVDRYRGLITGIMDTGESGNIQVTTTTV